MSVMLEMAGRIGRRLRAFFHCQPTETNPSHPKKLGDLPTVNFRGPKAITDGDQSAQDGPASTQSTQKSITCPEELPLSELPTIDDLLTEVGNSEHKEDLQQPSSGTTNELHGFERQLTSIAEHDRKPDHSVGDERPDVHLEEPVEWTPEQAQAVREANYVTFDSEDETDFTGGPARMVAATDGVVTCTALLVTFDLSKTFQRAMKAQRDYYKVKEAANQKTEALLRFESTLEAQIASHRSHLTMPDLDAARKSTLDAELFTLELMVDEYKIERTVVQSDLEFKGDMLRKVQARVNAAMEEAWIDAQLLEPEVSEQDSPDLEYDLQTEYQAFRRKLHDADVSPLVEDIASLDTSNDHLKTDMTAEERAHQEEGERLHEAVWDAWDKFEAADAAFSRRDETRFEAEQARRHAILRRQHVEDATSECFDLRMLQLQRELTRGLIEAEEVYHVAQKAAADAGVDDTAAEDSDDGEEDSDGGYGSSSEEEMISAMPSLRITHWLSDVLIPKGEDMIMPDVMDRSGLSGGDEWDAPELEVGDCVSHFCDLEIEAARNPHRARIDEWQKIQQELRIEFGAS